MDNNIARSILEFSQELRPWQQDLFRRAATQEIVTSGDLQDVLALLKTDVGLAEVDFDVRPLTAEHLRGVGIPEDRVVLTRISDAENVNRLASKQVLPFAKNGITLLYGDNGSGKSGYCRILKQLCRARRDRVEAVLPDVYASGLPSAVAKAKIQYSVGEALVEHNWVDGSRPPVKLSRITVFDAQTAPIYVDKQNQIDFLPEGLDVLPRVGRALQLLAEQLDSQIEALSRETVLPVLTVSSDTAVGALLRRLEPDWLGDLPSKIDIEQAAAWTDDDTKALNGVDEALLALAQPEKAAAKSRRMKVVLDRLASNIAKASESLSDLAVTELERLRQEAKAAAEAANAAATDAFKDDPFGSHVSTNAWQVLFGHARQFSEVVYPGQSFPVVGTGKHCVLCQQPLSEEASDRLTRFHVFLEQAASKHSAQLATSVRERINRIEQLSIPERQEVDTQLAEYAAENEQARSCVDSAAAYCQALRERRDLLIISTGAGASKILPPLPTWDPAVLSENSKALEGEAAEHEKSQTDAGQRNAYQTNRNELNARKLLHEQLATVLKRRELMAELQKLCRCRDECDTSSVSRKASALRDQYLTGGFEARLRDEVENLGVDYLPIQVESKSERGVSYQGIVLDQSAGARTAQVLSEGEFRVLALACFLAEIGGTAEHDGIVVDDPVSSLDHRHIRQVARRLVREAGNRPQVIVFTHNLPFYYELLEAAQEAMIDVEAHWIQRTEDKTKTCGRVAVNEAPWQVKKVKERMATLQHHLQNTPKPADCSETEYVQRIKTFYGLLRETWERLVEERLLNGVVGRFEPSVKTLSLKGASIEDTDYQKVFAAMKKASRYSGHDGPVSFQTSLPDLVEMQQDLEALRKYEHELKGRSTQVTARRVLLESPIKRSSA